MAEAKRRRSNRIGNSTFGQSPVPHLIQSSHATNIKLVGERRPHDCRSLRAHLIGVRLERILRAIYVGNKSNIEDAVPVCSPFFADPDSCPRWQGTAHPSGLYRYQGID